MKNYFEHRGAAHKLTFDPITKQFTTRQLLHPMSQQRDPLEQHLLNDLGIDTASLDRGHLKIAA